MRIRDLWRRSNGNKSKMEGLSAVRLEVAQPFSFHIMNCGDWSRIIRRGEGQRAGYAQIDRYLCGPAEPDEFSAVIHLGI